MGKHQTTLPVSWEICMQAKNQQLELNMEEQTASKWGKDYVKAVYCYPAYLTYNQSTWREMPDDTSQAGIKIAVRNINNLRYVDDTILKEKAKRN